MALVAYDYDSDSENEEVEAEEEEITPSHNLSDNLNNSIPELLSHLPKIQERDKTDVNVTEDKLEDFIPKYQATPQRKKPQKVKITIPALSEFDDEAEQPQEKKIKKSAAGSSLLAILPPVKGTPLTTRSFVPNVVKSKPPPAHPAKTANNALVPHAVRKRAEEAKRATLEKITKSEGSDAESDDDIEIPETFDDETWEKVCGRRSKPKPQIIETADEAPLVINIAPEPVKPYDGLDNAAFKELVGKSKRPVNVKLIDINEDEIVSDKDLWLTKSLTDPDTVPKPAPEDSVDPTRKKKHHITYLAEQAKANEQELQSQWSANKFTRNQTRAKYGF